MKMTITLAAVIELTAGAKPDSSTLIAAVDAAIESATSGTATVKAAAVDIREE